MTLFTLVAVAALVAGGSPRDEILAISFVTLSRLLELRDPGRP